MCSSENFVVLVVMFRSVIQFFLLLFLLFCLFFISFSFLKFFIFSFYKPVIQFNLVFIYLVR